MAKILLIEDDRTVAVSLQRLLESEGYSVDSVSTANEGLAGAERGKYDAVVTDLQMPGLSGLEVIRSLHASRPHLPVILMTGHHTTDTAIEATKFGAYDYIPKPIDQPQFLDILEKAVASSRAKVEPVEIGEPTFTKDAIVGRSRAMQDVYKDIGRLAAKPVTVLIQGETGTGKELVARALHHHGDRAEKPFVIVNCVAIPENLLESELFGHEAGAFTDAKAKRIGRFEQAQGGTIFLDEIGDMSMSTQGKLLRVLQEHTVQRLGSQETVEVDVRVVAATHRDLNVAIQEREFREDLFYRLNVAMIQLPALRDRTEDIPLLADYFWHRYQNELGPSSRGFAPEALSFLQQHPWPGNVRELENVVRKALLLARGYPVTPEHVKAALAQAAVVPAPPDKTLPGYIAELLNRAQVGEVDNIASQLNDTIERELYTQAIQLAKGDQTRAAKWLGVSRPTMREKLTRYGIHPSQST